ncbi:unnamed protein product [Peniophora sp. CBMAI 1063]|nr:unnamed protein product [Peniophora sp. CBMAI 1063]
MTILHRNPFRSRIVLSVRPSPHLKASAESQSYDPAAGLFQESSDVPVLHLDGDLPDGLMAKPIYARSRQSFFARLLSSHAIEQVYGQEGEEANEYDERELFALNWNGEELLDAVITIRELMRKLRVNGNHVDLIKGHKLKNGDTIEVGSPRSALGDAATSNDWQTLTYRFDALFIPDRTQENRTPYKALRWLGRGSYGQVAQVQNIANREFYAIKEVRTIEADKEEALREPLLWRDLIHECVCKYTRHWVDSDAGGEGVSIYTVISYAPFGTLADYIKVKTCDEPPNDLVNRRITSQICRAFDYLHGEDVAHCDFKPDNAVIDRLDADGNPDKVSVIDFGMALRFGHLHELCTAVEHYRAPEIGLQDASITLAIDSFAIAATVYCVATNGYDLVEVRYPVDSGSGFEVCDAKKMNELRTLRLDRLKNRKHLQDFIRRMSLEDPGERMSPQEALSHIWLHPEPQSSSETTAAFVQEVEPEAEPAEAKRTRSQRSPQTSASSLSSGLRYDKRARLSQKSHPGDHRRRPTDDWISADQH